MRLFCTTTKFIYSPQWLNYTMLKPYESKANFSLKKFYQPNILYCQHFFSVMGELKKKKKLASPQITVV